MNPKVVASLIVLIVVISAFAYVALGILGIIEIPGVPNAPGEPVILISGGISRIYDFTNFSYEYFSEGRASFIIQSLYFHTHELEIVGELYDPSEHTWYNETKFIGRVESGGVDLPFELVFSGFNTSHSHFIVTLKLFEHPNPDQRIKRNEQVWNLEI